MQWTTAEKLESFLRGLTPYRFSFLCKHVLCIGKHDLSTAEVLKLALCDWLTRNQALLDDDHQRILTVCSNHLGQVAAEFDTENERAPGNHVPVLFTIMDGRYVGLSSQRNTLYDLREDQFVEKTKQPAITYISCDLAALLSQLAQVVKDHAHVPDLKP
jgi:hypothetical protein